MSRLKNLTVRMLIKNPDRKKAKTKNYGGGHITEVLLLQSKPMLGCISFGTCDMVSVEKNVVCVPVSGCWDRIHGMGCVGVS